MPGDEKPYRVYRGGRVKGRISRKPERAPEPLRKPGEPPERYGGPGPKRRKRRFATWFAIAFGLFLLFWTAWALASYFAFRDGVQAANARLPASAKRALDHQDSLLLTNPTVILLLGTDSGPHRAGERHSDSIMLVRTDPDHHRIAYLSIPRDLRVEIPGVGTGKVNAAYQAGGARLAIATIRNLTGLSINHVVVVDFSQFEKLIDAIGGITVNVPKPILSNKFDCPYTAARCASWPGWRFAKGPQHMDGHRALIYSRIRENKLDPGESDATRAERQQQVLQATASKLASFSTFLNLPFDGSDLMRPLATDLSPGQLLALGWVKFRSGSPLHCRLGGQPETIGGVDYIIGEGDENRAAISMFLGQSAPQPPPPGSGLYGPGCVVGNATLGSR
jgi:LCP family protein required for cell wall assembly